MVPASTSSDLLNELLNSSLTGKSLKQHLALIVLSAGTEQNYLTPERDIKIPDRGEHKKPALLPSSRSLIKLAECCIQRLKVMWSPWVSHMYVLLRQRMKKKIHFASQLVSPTHILYTEKTSMITILVEIAKTKRMKYSKPSGLVQAQEEQPGNLPYHRQHARVRLHELS